MPPKDTMEYEVYEIAPRVWSIEDSSDSTCYLIEGRDKALLIDTGFGAGDLGSVIRSLTKLPVELAVTHAHGDHYLHAASFSVIYMHPEDIAILPRMNAMFADDMKGREVLPDRITPLCDGQVIDLGGGFEVEAMLVAGHTPGSIALHQKNNGMVYTGDAIGSGVGVWMQVPYALSVADYKKELKGFQIKLQGMERPTFWPGHISQAGKPGEKGYNPVTLATIRDMIALCGKLMAGTADSGPSEHGFGEEPARYAVLGTASMIYCPSRIG